MREDRELQEYRAVMEPPDRFEDGYNWKTLLGAIFIGFIMMPGAIYLGLVAGQSMGAAAEWVTIILFLEVAKRSFTRLKRQEIYILYYIAGSLVSIMGGVALSGGAFAHLIWNQYLVRSPAAQGFVADIPSWVAPQPDSPAILERTFLHKDWIPAIALLVAGQLLSRANWFGLGYSLFRWTSDHEKLPFPLAPVAAQGATALAESSSRKETWRWRCFSVGSIIGVVFGAVYVGIPTITGLLMVRPLHILPIPWIDFTLGTERFLPAAATGITANLGNLVVGMVLPYWAVVGRFIAAMAAVFVNPLLYKTGLLTTWQPGMDTIYVTFANWLDFWLSFSVGSAVAIFIIGIWHTVSTLKREKQGDRVEVEIHPKSRATRRGDLPVWFCLLLWGMSTLGYIALCYKLVPDFSLFFLVVFAFLVTPFQSYVNARMVGLTGQFVGFPMIREATFILSGYQGVKIWFAPIPLGNYGGTVQQFRMLELTGTKVKSLIKAEMTILPLTILCSLLFWQFVWRLGPIPSINYPYAQKMWHVNAMQRCLWISSTLGGDAGNIFRQAWKWDIAGAGLVFALGSYGILSKLNFPVMLVYGFIGGITQIPHNLIPEFIGAIIGRKLLAPRFGVKTWRQYAPVLLAGFSCGMGLISMCAIAIALVTQSITQTPF